MIIALTNPSSSLVVLAESVAMLGWRAMAVLMLGLLWCASSMAAGEGVTAEETLKGEVTDLFKTTRGGVKLTAALVLCLVGYFLGTLRIEGVDEVNKDDPSEMEEAASEGWLAQFGVDLPKPFAMRVRKWAGEVPLPSGSPSKGEGVIAGDQAIGNVKESDRRAAAKELADDMDLTPHEREKAEKDMAAQGLTCMRIVSLSQALILGRPVSMSECEGLKYGGGPQNFEAVQGLPQGGSACTERHHQEQGYRAHGGVLYRLCKGLLLGRYDSGIFLDLDVVVRDGRLLLVVPRVLAHVHRGLLR